MLLDEPSSDPTVRNTRPGSHVAEELLGEPSPDPKVRSTFLGSYVGEELLGEPRLGPTVTSGCHSILIMVIILMTAVMTLRAGHVQAFAGLYL